MKKRGFGLLISLALSVLLISCPMADIDEPYENNGPNGPQPFEPVPIGEYSGTGTGIGDGFASSDPVFEYEYGYWGPPITATVTMVDGWITAVTLDGPRETVGFGAELLTDLVPIIIAENTFRLADRHINIISGATFTYQGISEAVENAIEEIKIAWVAAGQLSISLNREILFLSVGEEEDLIAAVTPVGTTITWTSSTPAVATVDSTGKVTATGTAGQLAVITASVTNEDATETLYARVLVVLI